MITHYLLHDANIKQGLSKVLNIDIYNRSLLTYLFKVTCLAAHMTLPLGMKFGPLVGCKYPSPELSSKKKDSDPFRLILLLLSIHSQRRLCNSPILPIPSSVNIPSSGEIQDQLPVLIQDLSETLLPSASTKFSSQRSGV